MMYMNRTMAGIYRAKTAFHNWIDVSSPDIIGPNPLAHKVLGTGLAALSLLFVAGATLAPFSTGTSVVLGCIGLAQGAMSYACFRKSGQLKTRAAFFEARR